MKFSGHLAFLEEVQQMKFYIKKATKSKLKFLKQLQENCKLGQALKLSAKYYSLARACKMSYHTLSNLSDGKYAPISLMYGHFAREILEDEY